MLCIFCLSNYNQLEPFASVFFSVKYSLVGHYEPISSLIICINRHVIKKSHVLLSFNLLVISNRYILVSAMWCY